MNAGQRARTSTAQLEHAHAIGPCACLVAFLDDSSEDVDVDEGSATRVMDGSDEKCNWTGSALAAAEMAAVAAAAAVT